MSRVSYAWILVFCGVVAFIAASVHLNEREIWFSQLDQDSVLLINALRYNDGRPPTYFDHPAEGVYILYGGLLRALNTVGLSPIGKFSDLEKHADPIVLLPGLFYAGRWLSILIALLCVATAGAAIYVLTRNWEHAALGGAFLLGSSGLLLQSLFVRSELTSILFLCFTILFLTMFVRSPNRLGTLFFAGLTFGLAYATKILIIPFAAFVFAVVAWALTKDGRGERGSFYERARVFVIPAAGIGAICVLGFALISTFNLLLVPYAIHAGLEAAGGSARTWACIAATVLLGACMYAYIRFRRSVSRFGDRLIGGSLIALALLLMVSPGLVAALESLRGKQLPDAYHMGAGQVLVLSAALLALGVYILRNKYRTNLVSLQVRVSLMLMSGFFAGILCSLVLCSVLYDPEALAATNARLFRYDSMSEFSTSAPSSSVTPLVEELRTYLYLYLFQNWLLPAYAVLLVLALALQGTAARYLWPSLLLFGMGLLFMFVCAFRYYTEQYWIHIDPFLIAASALLIFGLIERFDTARTRMAVCGLIALLYVTQYLRVAETYPHYNPAYRDRIDEAAHAIHEVHDYAALMAARYGDNVAFMQRILSDPRLNGADRGIDLRARPAVKRVIEANPELQVK